MALANIPPSFKRTGHYFSLYHGAWWCLSKTNIQITIMTTWHDEPLDCIHQNLMTRHHRYTVFFWGFSFHFDA